MMNFSIEKPCYKMAARKDESAEITMYGEIVERRPVDWWTGEEVSGDFIIQSEFLEDLNSLIAKKVKSITMRMNSVGGDAGVSVLIHNRLREYQNDGGDVTCIVDGVAMSGGSLIMCACNHVRVNPSSLIMIHKCWSFYWGAYNADELRAMADSQDAFDRAQCSIYARKTGLSDTKIMHMMSETTYMTGAEAVEKGFADEVVADAVPVTLAASANGTSIFVNGKAFHLAQGMKAPAGLPIKEAKQVSTSEEDDINASGSDTDQNEGGNIPMAQNLEELRAENAELATVVEGEVRAAVMAENASAVSAAVEEERSRIAAIDEIASLYDAETVSDAKYGSPCSAQEMAFRAAQKAARTGMAFMANVKEDAAASHVNEVKGANAPEDKGEEDVEATAKADYEAFKKIKEGAR